MKRKRRSATRAWLECAETGALAPWVATMRLLGVGGRPPAEAAAEWNSWALEKAVAWQEIAWAATMEAMRGDIADAGSIPRIFKPMHKRVRRNARRKRRS
jgi:hypothetical protein